MEDKNLQDPRLVEFKRLLDIMDQLRAGCPWDKKQTFDTLRYLTIEETYELSEAILDKNPEEMAKEGVRRYRAWLKSIGMPQNFAELGAKESDIPALVEKLGLKGNTLGAFRPLNDADVAAILRIAAS